jgi:exonuclease III
MRLMSLNIKGGGDIEKVSETINFLTNNMADVAFLCETHMTEERVNQYRQRWQKFKWYTNCVSANSCGVTFIILRPDHIKLKDCKVIKRDGNGRVLGIELKVEGLKKKEKLIRILGIYAPNEESNSVNFFNNLHSERDPRFHIMLGDFNRCQEAHDRNPPRREDERDLNSLKKCTAKDKMLDGWRTQNPDEQGYTYWSNNDLRSPSHLDRIYVTQKVFRKCLQWEIYQTPKWTDHAAVGVQYCFRDQVETGEGQWYMNVHLLSHGSMKKVLSETIIEGLSRMAETLGEPDEQGNRQPTGANASQLVTQFDHLLQRIRTVAQQVQKDLSRQRNKIQKHLEEKIKKLDNKHRNKRSAKQLKSLQTRLEALMEVKAKRQTLLSKAKWLEMGLNNTADFWDLGKTVVEDRTIYGLKNPKGKVKKGSKKILKIARDYYH